MARSVLVVDDNAYFRKITATIIERWGHRVVGQAGSVREAVARASELRPDTVIVDIALPDGDGFELTRALVAMGWPVRVLVISADSDVAYDSFAERAGASGYCPKAEIAGVRFREAIERS